MFLLSTALPRRTAASAGPESFGPGRPRSSFRCMCLIYEIKMTASKHDVQARGAVRPSARHSRIRVSNTTLSCVRCGCAARLIPRTQLENPRWPGDGHDSSPLMVVISPIGRDGPVTPDGPRGGLGLVGRPVCGHPKCKQCRLAQANGARQKVVISDWASARTSWDIWWRPMPMQPQ